MISLIKLWVTRREILQMKNKSWAEHISLFILIIALFVMAIFMQNNNKASEERKIVGIHIKGEVSAPGYYELEYGSRVKDAILAAGSETKDAELSGINLAMNLSDGEEIVIPKKSDLSTSNNSKLININTADMYKLCKLDGIGESSAASIVDYRAKNGVFKTVNDLKKVKGIGNSKFNAIKDKITV